MVFDSGNDTTLWLTKNNGSSFEAVHHFDADIASIEVAWSNPDFIYLATYLDGGIKNIFINPKMVVQHGQTLPLPFLMIGLRLT